MIPPDSPDARAAPAQPPKSAGRSEWAVIFVVAAIQFFNILDFMMVMPLGPDFTADLGLPVSSLGMVGAAYAGSAAVAGLVGSLFLDAFDRRTALAAAMVGLVVGTAAGGAAQTPAMLLGARLVAGAFGGPATSLALAVVADLIPPQRRGRAMGVVMGSFSLAAILGVPFALQLAQWGTWRLAFFGVAGLGAGITVAGYALLPRLRGHLAAKAAPPSMLGLLTDPLALTSFLMTALALGGAFVLIPNLSAFTQRNLGYPRDGLSLLYMAGGVASFLVMPVCGKLVDRVGSFKMALVATALLVTVIAVSYVHSPPLIPVILMFVGFMVAMTIRNLAYGTLTTKVPSPGERARFMSLQSTVQHLASGGGSLASTWLLQEGADGSLVGFPRVAMLSIGASVCVVPLVWIVERRVRARAARAGQASEAAATPHPAASG